MILYFGDFIIKIKIPKSLTIFSLNTISGSAAPIIAYKCM